MGEEQEKMVQAVNAMTLCMVAYCEPVCDIATNKVSNVEDQETNQSREIGI